MKYIKLESSKGKTKFYTLQTVIKESKISQHVIKKNKNLKHVMADVKILPHAIRNKKNYKLIRDNRILHNLMKQSLNLKYAYTCCISNVMISSATCRPKN